MDLSTFVYIVAAGGGWLLAQIIKIFLSLKEDGFTWQDLVTSGGMPSSHVAFVSSVAVVIGLKEGIDSAVFGVILTVLGVVIYDAMGVRRATGENTKIIQQITQKLKIGDQRTALFLALGHSPYQVVAGLLLGIGWGNLVFYLLG